MNNYIIESLLFIEKEKKSLDTSTPENVQILCKEIYGKYNSFKLSILEQ